MKSKLFLSALIIVGATTVACKKTAVVSTGGAGGTGTTTAASSTGTKASNTTSTGSKMATVTGATTTTTAAGMGTCAAPSTDADCGSCTDKMSCFTCVSTADQSGVKAYNALVDCIFCKSCSTVAQSTAADCPMGLPTTKDACDTGTPGDMTAISACQMCATKAGGTCAAELAACQADPNCGNIITALPKCPM